MHKSTPVKLSFGIFLNNVSFSAATCVFLFFLFSVFLNLVKHFEGLDHLNPQSDFDPVFDSLILNVDALFHVVLDCLNFISFGHVLIIFLFFLSASLANAFFVLFVVVLINKALYVDVVLATFISDDPVEVVGV